MIKLELDYKVPSWNILYSGKHWSVRKKMADEAHGLVYFALLEFFPDKIIPLDTVKLDFEIHYKGKRRHDPDNVNIKILIDGFVKYGIIEDDNCDIVKEIRIRVLNNQKKDKVIIKII